MGLYQLVIHLIEVVVIVTVSVTQQPTVMEVSSSVSPQLRRSQFQCDLCGKIFVSTYKFKTHIIIHTGVEPYYCKDCYQTFS